MIKRTLAFIFIITLILVNTTVAKASRVNMTAMKPAITEFFELLENLGNIPVATTYAWSGNFKKDWDASKTFMKPVPDRLYFLSGNGVSVRVPTYDPPIMLNGTRSFPSQNDTQAGYMNVDGSVPNWDKKYVYEYRQWSTRPTLDLSNMILKNELYERLFGSVMRRHSIVDTRGDVVGKYNGMIDALGLRWMVPINELWLNESVEDVLAEINSMQGEGIPDHLSLKDLHDGLDPLELANQVHTDIEMFGNSTASSIDWLMAHIEVVGVIVLLVLALIAIFVKKREKVAA